MAYEEIIETLRTYATETLGDCPKDCPVKRRQEATCRAVFTEAASALENLIESAKNNEKRKQKAEKAAAKLAIELAYKQTENSNLRSELRRRMFRPYVVAEMRADTGVSTEEIDDGKA